MVLASASVSTAQPNTHPATTDGKPVSLHIHRAHHLFKRAYDLNLWSQGPNKGAIDKARAHKRAVLIDTVRFDLHGFRVKLSHRFHAYRRHRLEITPFAGPSGTYWAIPYSTVYCESKGSFTALNPSSGAGGAYQILPSTWSAYGGTGAPQAASPDEQHEVAHRVWLGQGPEAWVCS